MVDLHHHLLPALDDGSPDLETSVAMARMAAADGITHVVCTPHASSRYIFDPALNSAKLHELRAALAAAAIPLTLGSGCDFHMSYDNIQDALAHPEKYAINEGPYILVELPDFGLPPGLDETFYELQLAGLIPILTHPERNATVQRDPSRLINWLRSGVLNQITTSSILGHLGKTAQRLSHKLLADRWVHFLSTDAHNLTNRPPQMQEACDIVAKKYGLEYARRLCIQNPLAVFEGRRLPPQDEPLHLYDDYDRDPTIRWWHRLLPTRRSY